MRLLSDLKMLPRRISQPCGQASLEFVRRNTARATKRALPDRSYSHSELEQRSDVPGISGPIGKYLGTPELGVGLRPLEARTLMAMPKTAIHEDRRLMLGEKKVR